MPCRFQIKHVAFPFLSEFAIWRPNLESDRYSFRLNGESETTWALRRRRRRSIPRRRVTTEIFLMRGDYFREREKDVSRHSDNG